jgi:hypothetical protein
VRGTALNVYTHPGRLGLSLRVEPALYGLDPILKE